jgi:hypothetical protein
VKYCEELDKFVAHYDQLWLYAYIRKTRTRLN